VTGLMRACGGAVSAADALQAALEWHLASSSVRDKQSALAEVRSRLAYDFSGEGVRQGVPALLCSRGVYMPARAM